MTSSFLAILHPPLPLSLSYLLTYPLPHDDVIYDNHKNIWDIIQSRKDVPFILNKSLIIIFRWLPALHTSPLRNNGSNRFQKLFKWRTFLLRLTPPDRHILYYHNVEVDKNKPQKYLFLATWQAFLFNEIFLGWAMNFSKIA